MKKLYYLIVLTLILGLVLTGCLLSNVGQVPTSEQSDIAHLTKGSSSGLVGLWHFDELSGTTASDSSGNGNHGTVSGASWVDGKFGKALIFDGDDYVSVDNSLSLNDIIDVTVELWLKPAIAYTASAPDYYVFLSKFGPNSFQFVYHKDGYLYLYVTGDMAVRSSALTLDADTWYHLAATFDSGTNDSHIYVDGVDVTSSTIIQPMTVNESPLFIGARPSPSPPYPKHFVRGTIDEVRIWNTTTPSFNLNVEPKLDFNPVGTDHTVTATVTIGDTEPAPGVLVDFTVNGDNKTSYRTNSEGVATFTYTSSVAGEDIIKAEINEAPYESVSVEVTKYWLENFVTGGGKINKSNGKKVAWTFAGTVGNLEDGSVGQFQIVDHTKKIAYHCNNNFSYLVFSGGIAQSPMASHNTAEFTGTFTNNKNAVEDVLTIIIEDNGEPGAGLDTISVTGFTTLSTDFSDTINGGNFQVHDL